MQECSTARTWGRTILFFILAFVGSVVWAILAYTTTPSLIRSPDEALVTFAGILWLVYAVISARALPLRNLLAIAVGLVWGFLSLITAVISQQQGYLAVHWPTMIPGLLLIPPAATLSVLPFWHLGRKLEPEDRRRINRFFGMAFVGSAMLSALVFGALYFIHFPEPEIVFFAFAAMLWLVYVVIATRALPLRELLAIVTGLVWGSLIVFIVHETLTYGFLDITGLELFSALLLIPIAVTLPVLPMWYLARRRRARETTQA